MHHDPADIAQDARNALTAALGRLQLLRRQAERGEADLAELHATLIATEVPLRRLVALIDALEDTATEVAPTGAHPVVRRVA